MKASKLYKVCLPENEEKMEFLINLNAAYIFVMAAVMLLITTIISSRSFILKILTVLFLGMALYELAHLKANLWTLVVVTLSMLPFLAAIRQTRFHLPLLAVTILLLIVGSKFLFTDQNGRPINLLLTGIVSVFCAEFIWIVVRRELNFNNPRISNDRDSLVGIIGEAYSEIHEFGSVRAEGQIWQAHSENIIPAGSTVRILRQDGFVLTVKKVENLTKK